MLGSVGTSREMLRSEVSLVPGIQRFSLLKCTTCGCFLPFVQCSFNTIIIVSETIENVVGSNPKMI